MGKGKDDAGGAGIAAGTVIDGRYKVVRVIGQGGNGTVHEVEHVTTGRRLALKALIDEAGFGRLQQEARATSLMKNAHATRITDLGKGPPAFLVMELHEGQSLRELLDEAGQLPLELTVNVALQVCECLAEAHKAGIVHRDLKPENVFLSPSPWPGQHEVKVLDFGVVKIAADGNIPNSSLTRTGSTVGTPYYMSLEQLRNSSAVDSRADVYALGVVLYECFSGKKPFLADTIGDLVYALVSVPPTHLSRLRPDLPGDVCDIVMKALSVNKEERPKTMEDFAAALLPHGNAAFALWVRIDGKQPALVAAKKVLSPEKAMTMPPGSKPAFGATATFAPRPVPPKPRPLAGQIPPSPAPVPLWTEEGTPGDDETRDRQESRDTPTEMYMKDGADADDGGSGKDRDTPTRAIRTDLLEEQRRNRPHHATLKSPASGAGGLVNEGSPGGGARGVELGFNPNAPTDLGSTLALDPNAQSPLFPMPVIPPPYEPTPYVSPFARPGADFGLGPEMAMQVERPGWQRSLDGALAWVGRFVESSIGKYRSASPAARAAILIALSVFALAFLGLVVLALIR